VDGIIIPDLPVEEAGELRRAALAADLSTVFFLAPTTTKERMPMIVKASTGFIYFLSVAGVTGARTAVPADLKKNILLAKKLTNKPICVGFGISTPHQVRSIAGVADGVIVGSAIVKVIEKNSQCGDMVKRVAAFVKKLTRAV